jgi:replicative DNA helicase
MINVSDAITKTAKDTRIPVILGSQFSRDATAQNNSDPPKLHHLKESGSLEEDANNVWGLHRPAGNKEDTKTELCLYILKNREGEAPEDPIKIKWNKLEWKIN